MNSPLAIRPARRGSAPTALIALTGLFGLALGGAFQLLREHQDAAASERVQARLVERGREGAQRLASLLTGARVLREAPDGAAELPASGVWLERETGDRGATELGLLAFELEQCELDDGLDNDGDGLVDEGCVVLTREPGGARERRLVVCRGVCGLLEGELANERDDNANGAADEPGFHVELSGRMATVSLTLQCADPARGVARSHSQALARTRLP